MHTLPIAYDVPHSDQDRSKTLRGRGLRTALVVGVIACGVASLAGASLVSPSGLVPRDESWQWYVTAEGGEMISPASLGSEPPGISEFLSSEEIAPAGVDRRKRIRNTTSYPARAHVRIQFGPAANNDWCTGFLLSPDTVVTSAHCLFRPNGWVPTASIRVTPGQNGSTAPFGSCSASQIVVTVEWLELFDGDYDYGAIRLNCTIGARVGFLPLFLRDPSVSLIGAIADLAGYPRDKGGTKLWFDTSEVTDELPGSRRPGFLLFTSGNFVDAGNSGSPVLGRCTPGGPCVLGINRGAFSASREAVSVRIHEQAFEELLDYAF